MCVWAYLHQSDSVYREFWLRMVMKWNLGAKNPRQMMFLRWRAWLLMSGRTMSQPLNLQLQVMYDEAPSFNLSVFS